MTKAQKPVVWDKQAFQALLKIYKYIQRDSHSSAEKVKEGILKITRTLSEKPFKFPPDKFKSENSGEYRAFEKYSYRIAYKVEKKQIVILRIRHVKQEPLSY